MFDQIAKKYGVMNYAMGGPVMMSEGGLTAEQLRAQIEAGPRTQAALDQAFATYTPAQLAAAFPEYGGVEDYTRAAAEAAARNSPPPAQDTSGFTAGPMIGPGPDTRYQMAGGTMDQGYSRDYTPEQRIGINQAYIRSQQDANYGVQGLMADMEKTGVTAKDLALSYGIDPNSTNQYLIRGGASPEFGGINTDWDTQKQDEFIAWQNSQPNPYGQGTLADVYRAQGISDTDPVRRAQAQEVIERQKAREGLRAGITMSGGVTGGGVALGPAPVDSGMQPGPSPSAGQPQPFTPPPVYEPPMPFTGPGGTIYPNSIQTPQGPQPTYFPTSWWTSSPTASNAYGRTTGSTARNFDAEMVDYRAKYAPVFTRPTPPPPILAPAANPPNQATKPAQDPGPGMEWFWNGAAWVVRFAGQNDNQPGSSSGSGGGGDSGAGAGAGDSGSGTGSGVGNSGEGGGGPGTGGWARGGEVNTLWNKYHG
jgi:hypothetical protein